MYLIIEISRVTFLCIKQNSTKRDQVRFYVFLDQNIAINHTLACFDEFVKECSLIDFTAPKIVIIIMSRLVVNVYPWWIEVPFV